MQYTIYKLTSISGKCYIGLTSKSAEWRWRSHITAWKNQLTKNKRYNCPKLFKSFEKYNPFVEGNWIVEKIDDTNSMVEAISLEESYIKKYNSYEEGYNAHPGGKFSNGTKGRKQTPEHISKRFDRDCSLSAETKHKQSISRKLMFNTEEGMKLRAKLSEYAKNQPKQIGRICSESAKQQIGLANSKSYKIMFPDGNIHEIIGLQKFCDEFNLTKNSLSKTRPGGKFKQHKGYKIISAS
jgi:hypothetical protein